MSSVRIQYGPHTFAVFSKSFFIKESNGVELNGPTMQTLGKPTHPDFDRYIEIMKLGIHLQKELCNKRIKEALG